MGRAGLVLSREAPSLAAVADLASRLGEAESALLRVITALARLEPVSAEVVALATVRVRREPPCIALGELPVHADAVGMRFAAVVDLLSEEGLLAPPTSRCSCAAGPRRPPPATVATPLRCGSPASPCARSFAT